MAKKKKPDDQIRVSSPAPEPSRPPADPMEAVTQATAGRERRVGDGPEVFRNVCAKCGAKINYAFARRAALPGICGKCLDEHRRALRDELSYELLGGTGPRSTTKIVHYFPRRVAARNLIFGLLAGFAAALALAAWAPGWFATISERTRQSGQQIAVWAIDAYRAVVGWFG